VFYRNGKNNWNKDYFQSINAMIAITGFTKLLIVSDKRRVNSDVAQTFYMEGQPRELCNLADMLKLTDAR
jgi:hypothetical protein